MSRGRLQIEDKISDKDMDLSCEGITEVPVREIAGYTRVNNIDLSNNHIRTLPNDFSTYLRQIVQLDLSKNLLQKLPENFGLLINLKHLDLYSNQIERLPLSMAKLRKLRWLDLKDNPLVPSLKKIVGECWNAEQCKACSKNVVEFMNQIEQRVGLIDDLAGNSVGEGSLQKTSASKRRNLQNSNDVSNGRPIRNEKASPSPQKQEFSSDDERELMASDSVSSKKKRKQHAKLKTQEAETATPADYQPDLSISSSSAVGNFLYLARSTVWLILFVSMVSILCGLCLSSDGFKEAIDSTSSNDRVNKFLVESHALLQTRIVKSNVLTLCRDFGKDALALSSNYFNTLVESLKNSFETITGAKL